MNGRAMEKEFKPSRAFALQMASHQVFREAMTVYFTDPKQADNITAAIAKCIATIQEYAPETEAGQGQGEIEGGPDCPDGTEERNGRCVPVI